MNGETYITMKFADTEPSTAKKGDLYFNTQLNTYSPMMEHLGGHFGKVCFFSFVLKNEGENLPHFDISIFG